MPAADHLHSPTPEEVMAYVDGEGTTESRAVIETHLATCRTCQAVASDVRLMTGRLADWTVEDAPESLRAPVVEERRLRWSLLVHSRRLQLAAAAGVVLAVTFVAIATRRSAPATQNAIDLTFRQQNGPGGGGRADAEAQGGGGGGSTRRPAFGAARPSPERMLADEKRTDNAKADIAPGALQPSPSPRQPMVIRMATLRIVVKSAAGVRAETERLVADAGGFIDSLTVAGDAGTPQTVRGVLRVPSDRLAQVIARLRQLGQVIEDTQQTEDVTDQIVDLDTRLANARATEQRLAQILKERTGKLSDVLDVEREIARVRLEIEQMDGQRTNLGRRVTYATITVEMTEERKASSNAPLSFATRLRIAASDGVDGALETLVGALLFAVSTGPTLIVWMFTAGLIWIGVRRARRLRIITRRS